MFFSLGYTSRNSRRDKVDYEFVDYLFSCHRGNIKNIGAKCKKTELVHYWEQGKTTINLSQISSMSWPVLLEISYASALKVWLVQSRDGVRDALREK